jgi:hypothetical protein
MLPIPINVVTVMEVTSNRVPYADWIKMTQEQRVQLIAKRNQERLAKAGGTSKSFAPPRHANMRDVDTFVDLDHLIDYATMKHETAATDAHSNADEDGGSELLAYMTGQKSSCGDVQRVLASKQTPDKNKKRHVNEGNSAPSSVEVYGNTYFLNKG